MTKVYLFDLDQVCVGFHIGATMLWRQRYPDEVYIKPEDMRKMYASQNYPAHLQGKFRAITYERGFFRNLPPIPGAIDAMDYIGKHLPNVFICSKPLNGSRHCVQEKIDWVLAYLGRYFAERVILTNDKTLVFGTYLIDDMPHITGVMTPMWEHLLFNAPYNQDIVGKKRIDWSNYKEVLGI